MTDEEKAKKKEESLNLLKEIYVAFGFDDVEPEDDSALYPSIYDGSLSFDQSKNTITYKLKIPVELKNDETLEFVTFKEAPAADAEYIRKGVVVDSNTKTFPLGDLALMTQKVLIRTGNISTNVAGRIMSRDIDLLSKIMAELGFFFR